MNRIINPQQLKLSIVKIIYKKNQQGTGFFITESIIMTAYHIMLDEKINDEEIQIILNDGTTICCTVLSIDEENDFCLLKGDFESKFFLPLYNIPIRINENWESYGFPYRGDSDGLRIFGTVNELIDNEKYDFILNCSETDKNYNYEGLSGSPVVCYGKVIGIVLKQLDDKIGAISLNRMIDFLHKKNISVKTEVPFNEIPKQFEDELKDLVSNYDVQNRLDDSIKESGNWILLEGNPGTGKTFNVASYVSEENNLVVGKYFTKIPNDDKPKSLRISNDFFLTWLEETISLTLTGNIAPKNNDPLVKRIEQLSYLFSELDSYLAEINKTGVFFIDGLDEINNLEDFLGIIPLNIPDNIKIVLACTSKEILPSNIKNILNTNQSILVSPLVTSQCEFYIQRKLYDELDFENIQKIALKSEGHPLYLNYLIDFINLTDVTDDEDELNEWIENIPVISGNIINYYNIIWDKIYQNSNQLWICLVLSQLRQAIDKGDLLNILPSEIRSHFYSVFPKINYLIKGGDKLEIYHNSFKEFILSKVPLFKKDCNDIIVKFCENHCDSIYAVTNNIYHYSLSNSPEKAVINCNQEWADIMAVNHIEPDLVISDIKNVIELSINLQLTTEIIRILLLLQRIDFRYNSVFVEYAHEIALALIANKKYSQAIKYIVRRDVLLISIGDAIHFLQHFYENNASVEVEILNNAIEKEYRRLINDASDDNGLHSSTFIVKAQTIILGSTNDLKIAQMNLLKYLNILRQSLKNLDDHNSEITVGTGQNVQFIRDYCCSWNNAYLLRNFKVNMDVERMMEVPEIKINESWAGTYAISLLIYRKEINNFNLKNLYSTDDEKALIPSIELLIENYGYVKEKNNVKNIISALITNSSKTEILKTIITEYLTFENELDIRNKNGVDFEYLNYEELCLRQNCLGFLEENDDLPIYHKLWNHKSWENDILALINEIHFLEGKLYYFKSSNQISEKLIFIRTKLEEITKSINYTFDYRSHWQRSYQLPEEIFPLIYSKLISIINEFDKDRLELFLESLKIKSKNQLGLYTEGYRNVLHEIIKCLISIEYEKLKILPFIELWENHVLGGIENRWERTEEFLKIIEIYGILNFIDKSDNVFQEMLNTSMGPSWYKESQLTPINTTLKILKSKPDNEIIQNFASILDYASGEMTFQRYVKYNKEVFISSLIKNNRLNEALEYYKFEVFPNPKVIIRNAEISSFDAPRLGDGYALGARNITEQSGILNILEKDTGINPYLKWALCEIFTINDDIFRYITDYGNKIATVLNEIEELEDGNINSICKSVSVLIASPLIENDDRKSLLLTIAKNLSTPNVRRIQDNLSEYNISWVLNEDIENSSLDKKPKEKDNFDLFNEDFSKPEISNNNILLQEGLQTFVKERRSIWFNNWSKSADRAKDNIKMLLEDDKSVISNLKDNILKFDEEYWVICKELIWFLEGKLDETQISEIYKNVNMHFHHIVRPNEEVKEKYSWLNNDFDNQNGDELVVKFIIWHLNHPDSYIRDKTSEILKQLVIYYPFTFKSLLNTCLINKPELSTEVCSQILLEISSENPDLIIEFFSKNKDVIDEISKIEHFTIKKNLIDLAKNLDDKGFNQLHLKIQSTIPKSIILSGEVSLEDDYLDFIQYEIDDLNEKLFLDAKFCLNLNLNIDDYCDSLSKEEILKSDKYLKRSFYTTENVLGRYNYYLKHALNNAINHRISENNIELVDEIINPKYV